jgi:hypothetical protein
MSLTVAEVREHVETELGDEALQRLLDAAYQAIDAEAGQGGDRSELLHPGGDLLFLSRRAESMTSVVERSTTLDATDYLLRPGGLLLQRLSTGTHPSSRWHGRIDVTYRAFGEEAERDRVALALLSLDVTHQPGLASQSLGAWSESYQPTTDTTGYTQERAAILASLNPPDLYPV